jgi:hypothetical protein
MADLMTLAAQLRARKAQEDAIRIQQGQQGGVAIGGMQPVGGSSGTNGLNNSYAQQQQQSTSSPLSAIMDGATKYNQVSKGGLNNLFSSSAGSSLGATGSEYAGSGLGGTGYGLGGSLVAGGGSGEAAGSGLSSALASYGTGSSTGGFGALGSTTSGGLGGLLGGSTASGGGSLSAGASSGSGAAAGGLGGIAGLAALGYLGDKEMNENKGSIINADKLNNAGTLGGSGIGIRFGDFANGFNPATWLSDPKKAGKGLVNGFTFGLADKVFDIF